MNCKNCNKRVRGGFAFCNKCQKDINDRRERFEPKTPVQTVVAELKKDDPDPMVILRGALGMLEGA